MILKSPAKHFATEAEITDTGAVVFQDGKKCVCISPEELGWAIVILKKAEKICAKVESGGVVK